jgi:hypothetical protein
VRNVWIMKSNVACDVSEALHLVGVRVGRVVFQCLLYVYVLNTTCSIEVLSKNDLVIRPA